MNGRSILKAAALALAAGGLAGCESMSNPFAAASGTAEEVETFAPVTTEEEFRAEVVGRDVAYANGSIGSYGEDGTWTVTGAEGPLARGTWEWRDGQWCYQGSTASGPVAETCESVAVSDTGVRFTRADGTEGTLPFRT